MVSWDLFATLCAGRDPSKRDGHQDQHVPIAQNIAKVRPGDLVVSDYFDAAKAQRILRDVCGLENELIVTEDGKLTGRIWEELARQGRVPQHHTGDDPITDRDSCKRAGIPFTMTTLAKFTKYEEAILSHGLPGLAALMREARLASWSPDETLRGLQLFQAQCNLPFLFLASIEIHRRMGDTYKRLLLSSRDCFLWHRLFTALLPALAANYECTYFYTSRLTRYWPSEHYRAYVDDLLSVPALVVDLCGSGASFRDLLGPQADNIVLLVGYKPCHVPHLIDGWLNEVTNFARHPMISDAGKDFWRTTNPLCVDWEAIPQLNAMHNAFLYAVSMLNLHNFEQDLLQPDAEIHAALFEVFSWMDDWMEPLSVLTPFRVAEAQATAELINARGKKDGVVV